MHLSSGVRERGTKERCWRLKSIGSMLTNSNVTVNSVCRLLQKSDIGNIGRRS